MFEKSVAVAGLLAFFAACDGKSLELEVVARDSAGTTILVSNAPKWSPGEEWRIDPDPFLQIGVVEGDSVYQFFRVFSAVRLSDGRIVTADQTTNRLRFFGLDGQFLKSVGGKGSGPGEFEGLFQVTRLTADSLLAYDGRLRRVMLLDSTGKAVSTMTLAQPGPEPIAGALRLSDGRIVSATGWSSAQLKPPIESGLSRSPSPVFVFGSSGEVTDTVGTFPGMDMAVTSEDGRITMSLPPFGHTLSMAVRGEQILIGTGDSYEVREFTPAGRLLRILRGPDADLSLDPAGLRAFRQANLDLLPDAETRGREERRLATVPLPERKPAFSRMLVDAAGHLWLSPFESFAYMERAWTVVHPEGAYLGTVMAPQGLRVLDVGEDYVLGRWQDESQVEYIRLHRLIKP